jgi:ankyrin repeat protein
MYAAFQGLPQLARRCLAAGIDPNEGQYGLSPLACLGPHDNPEVAEILLRHGARRGFARGLQLAAHYSSTGVVRVLITRGAYMHPDLNDALDYAVDGFRPDSPASLKCTEVLLSRGARVNARNKAGRTPLDVATAKGHPKLAALLRRYGGKRSSELRPPGRSSRSSSHIAAGRATPR